MTQLRQAIEAIYAQVGAPGWAAPNLDALADVLRDLSWLPEGTVTIRVPDTENPRVLAVVQRAVVESVGAPRPVRLSNRSLPHTE